MLTSWPFLYCFERGVQYLYQISGCQHELGPECHLLCIIYISILDKVSWETAS